jgi:non-specific serine/threonine protein kinase/serine/threonine-protein kinase
MADPERAREPEPSPQVEELHREFLERWYLGEAVDIEELCRAHPAVAPQLRRVHEDWQRMSQVLERLAPGVSFSERLRSRYGEQALPSVALDREPPALASPLLTRLLTRTPRESRYRLIDEIGRGGMGAVLRVWDEDLRRQLAMKVILDKRDQLSEAAGAEPDISPQRMFRFLEEAQITGQLDHPGIVPVHELGLDRDGRVYFTMRLVKGQTMKQVFELVRDGKEGWSQTRALGVMLRLCEAMAYAHSKSVIHRDLKPSNIMVGRFGETYVMDWGVARVVGRDDARSNRPHPEAGSFVTTLKTELADERALDPESPLFTIDGDVVGTPPYMSPEQAKGLLDQVGPRSDVYSVGAILYDLLTGQMPYVPRGARPSKNELLAMLLREPPTPVHELNPRVPAELVAICEKAMARAPQMRYADMIEMAEDLRAYLEERVVRAYETGSLAELKKWYRRNKPLAVSVAAALVFLLGGMASTVSLQAAKRAQERRANQVLAAANLELERSRAAALAQADEARAQRLAAQRVASFMINLFEAPDPALGNAPDITAREMLDRGMADLKSGLDEDPLVRAQLMAVIGSVYDSLSLYQDAEPLIDEALALRRDKLGADHPDTLAALAAKATLLLNRGRTAEAEPVFAEVVAKRSAVLGDHDPSTVDARIAQSELLRAQGRFAGAEALLHRALEDSARATTPDPAQKLAIENDLALNIEAQGRFEEAGRIFAEVLEARSQLYGEEHPRTLIALNNLAGNEQKRGRYADALPRFQRALATCERLYRPDHPRVLLACNNLGGIHLAMKHFTQAQPLFERALEGLRGKLGESHPQTLETASNLAQCYEAEARYADAEALLRKVVDLAREALGDDHPITYESMGNLAGVLESEHRYDDAESLYREALAMMLEQRGENHPKTLTTINNLAFLYLSQQRYDQAAPLMQRAYDGMRAVLGLDHPDTVTTLYSLVHIYVMQGRLGEAEPLARTLVEHTPEGHPRHEGSRSLLERILQQRH